ncbi:MAG: TipAS antibiotic-recognition domain-containing protein [Arthrobacter sp.]
MEWSVQHIARIAGTTSRTLRHYDDLGLLKPSRSGNNGYRFYDQASLLRLQRILLLRDLGLGLPAIAEVPGHEPDAEKALDRHLDWLRQEQQRLARQISSVRRTIAELKAGVEIMAATMFDGFDHTKFQDEVEQRWGADTYATSDAWWRGMSQAEKEAWKQHSRQLGNDWIAAAESGIPADGSEAQELARRQVEWLAGIPGTPAAPAAPGTPAAPAAPGTPAAPAAPGTPAAPSAGGGVKGYVTGLAEMYVADPRFAANYGGEAGASFVGDALRIHAGKHL